MMQLPGSKRYTAMAGYGASNGFDDAGGYGVGKPDTEQHHGAHTAAPQAAQHGPVRRFFRLLAGARALPCACRVRGSPRRRAGSAGCRDGSGWGGLHQCCCLERGTPSMGSSSVCLRAVSGCLPCQALDAWMTAVPPAHAAAPALSRGVAARSTACMGSRAGAARRRTAATMRRRGR